MLVSMGHGAFPEEVRGFRRIGEGGSGGDEYLTGGMNASSTTH